MTSSATFFFCHVVGKKVFNSEGKLLGRLRDLIADPAFPRPQILAAVVACKNVLEIVDFSTFEVRIIKGRSTLVSSEMKPANLQGLETIHVSQLMNKKIVDMEKKNTISVYDIKIAIHNDMAYIVAVDAGQQGRLRQLGLENIANVFFRLFDLSIRNQLVMWNNVEAINVVQTVLGLSQSMSKLNRLHPSELADIIEEMDDSTQMEIFSALDTVRAADILEELNHDTQDNLLENMPSDQFADVLEIMPADEVADILDEADKKKVEELLNEMDNEVSGEVRELMEYDDNVVGSLMMTEFLSVREADTIEIAMEMLRQKKPEYDTIYYLYVVSDAGTLEAILPLRDIVVSSPEIQIGDIMNRDVIYAYDTDTIVSLNNTITKYNLLAVPVVNADMVLLGTVIINDAFFHLLRSKRKML
jgi:magnesium transporter